MVKESREKINKKIRIDQVLVINGFFPSREKAQASIMAGEVIVEGQVVKKSSEMVLSTDNIVLKSRKRFVSRGGEKLNPILDLFNIDVIGLSILDVGASTGGFTDCILKRGALKVIALDVGKGQLDWKLRNDSRVVVMEGINARYLDQITIEPVDFAVIDVSFISLEKILPSVKKILKKDASVVALIKPQFEAGPKNVGKGGVVRDEAVRSETVEKIKKFASDIGFKIKGVAQSPLKGPAGNVEFFIYLQ
ncbi:MAG: TlyA family RNA methyltransferase [Candidatus Theseobacter exili]|nr:TlyA family RNA methyltransferase [Candidatus Theseobacter exili]